MSEEKKTKLIDAYELKDYINHLIDYRRSIHDKVPLDLYTLLGHIVCLIEKDENEQQN